MIKAEIRDKSTLEKTLKNLLKTEFKFNDSIILSSYERFNNTIKSLKNNICFVIEFPYIDKVYRDSYYYYYSTKLNNYCRNCIRISLFKREIREDSFLNLSYEEIKNINKDYLGFMILRPTELNILGRSIISPEALIKDNLNICRVSIPASVNGVKLLASGFPHSSQDSETISCAETTIWALMEYFGYKYSDYTPVLPSMIANTLYDTMDERQLPSSGLFVGQISYAIKSFGFGTIIYSRDEYGSFFDNLISCYVESGIPLIIGIQSPSDSDSIIGHATICIGHRQIEIDRIDDCSEFNTKHNKFDDKFNLSLRKTGIKIYDFDDIEKEFVFNDDNLPIYHTTKLDTPMSHEIYNINPNYSKCYISHFAVPLYSKIYLEAYSVKNYIYDILLNEPYKLEDKSEVLIKIFLTSSRSYKNFIACEKTIDSRLKELIIAIELPKFIWVVELSNKELFKNKKINGLIILDSTEPRNNDKLFIIGAYQDKLINFDENSNNFKIYSDFIIGEFNFYKNNLKENGEEY